VAEEKHGAGIQEFNPDSERSECINSGYNGRVARKKPFISKVNLKKRLKFTNDHKKQGLRLLETSHFSDESKFNIFGSGGRHMVWQKKKKELESKNLIPTVKHGDGSVLVWGCMSAAGVGNLHFIEGIMNHVMYIDILKQNLRSSSIKMGMGNQFIFQQDNDPKHRARKAKEWLLYNTPKHLHSSPQSPDMNPIENLWSYLDVQIRNRQIKSKSQLKAALLEE